MYRRGLNPEPFPDRCTIAGGLLSDAAHAFQRPAKVHSRWPRPSQEANDALHATEERNAPLPPMSLQSGHQSHRRRDSDQRRSPYLERADRLGDILGILQVPFDSRPG